MLKRLRSTTKPRLCLGFCLPIQLDNYGFVARCVFGLLWLKMHFWFWLLVYIWFWPRYNTRQFYRHFFDKKCL